jgi:hypothetical protein
MTNCKCVCVKKKKKKKTMPKPVKQQALIDRYNSQTPLINLPAYQTTFREPMKRKKYSVYKAPIIEVVREIPKSKISTPLIKPPLPMNIKIYTPLMKPPLTMNSKIYTTLIKPPLPMNSKISAPLMKPPLPMKSKISTPLMKPPKSLEIPLDTPRMKQSKLRREEAEKRLLANIEKIPTPKPKKSTQEKSTQVGFDVFYRRPPNLPPLESKAQEFIAKTKRPSLTPVDNDPLMGTPPGSPTPAPPFLGRTRSPRPLQADPTMNQPVQRFPTASRTLFADTGAGAGAGVFPK